jgi:hypothetical protein
MKVKQVVRLVAGVALAIAPVAVLAQQQFTTPHVITTPGDVTATLGPSAFVNHGLVGVGRLSASGLDVFGETFGSVSSLQITGWTRNSDGTYSGVMNILPDRGYNSGGFYSDYAARINQVGFTFAPYTGASGIGGSTDAEKIAAQHQISFTTPVTGVKFTYDDPIVNTTAFTTGLDPGIGYTTLFGQTLPYVFTFLGPQSPGAAENTLYNVNRLPLDSEALILKSDGSGYVGDEYGANIYYFNSSKKIVGAIVPPLAFQPHAPAGVLNFSAVNPPVDGRRNNQGLEGVSLSPDGTRLFALLQSATIQDSNSDQQNRKQTRLLVYDVTTGPTPAQPIAEYALTLPTLRLNGNGSAVNRTAAQSEVVALDNHRLLVLSRDGNGLGNTDPNPSVYKTVLLVDTGVGNPTNFADSLARNAVGGTITTSPGVLDPAITPLQWVEALNMLNSTQLSKFNVALDSATAPVSKLTLSEKWEGMALVYAEDPTHPNDYFLFLGNDNDFLTSDGHIKGPGGLVSYNGFAGYQASRIPPPVPGPAGANENDTVFLAYRVTITPDPTAPLIVPHIAGTLGNNGWYTSAVTVTWDVSDPQSTIVSSSGCGPTALTSDTTGVVLTCSAVNGAGLNQSVSISIKIDRTPPEITGLPATCSLWPPNHKLVPVATVHATDALSGLVAESFKVSGTSSGPTDPENPDVVIESTTAGGFVVLLRAERAGGEAGRVYTIAAVASDIAGNHADASATCLVPHDQGNGKNK